jgi:hypothetical protein
LAVVKNDLAHRFTVDFVGLEQRFLHNNDLVDKIPLSVSGNFLTNDAVQFINALVGKRHHTVLEQVVQAFNDAKIVHHEITQRGNAGKP